MGIFSILDLTSVPVRSVKLVNKIMAPIAARKINMRRLPRSSPTIVTFPLVKTGRV